VTWGRARDLSTPDWPAEVPQPDKVTRHVRLGPGFAPQQEAVA
jgi:hypothetical protein